MIYTLVEKRDGFDDEFIKIITQDYRVAKTEAEYFKERDTDPLAHYFIYGYEVNNKYNVIDEDLKVVDLEETLVNYFESEYNTNPKYWEEIS